MFSMIKIRELDEVESRDADVNKRHYGEHVTFYLIFFHTINISCGSSCFKHVLVLS